MSTSFQCLVSVNFLLTWRCLRYFPFSVDSPAPSVPHAGRETKIICIDLDTFKADLECRHANCTESSRFSILWLFLMFDYCVLLFRKHFYLTHRKGMQRRVEAFIFRNVRPFPSSGWAHSGRFWLQACSDQLCK